MRRVFVFAASALLLAACETAPTPVAQSTGGGGGGGSGSTLGGAGAGQAGVNANRLPGSEADQLRERLVQVGNTVFFDSDSSSLTGTARDTLDKQNQWLRQFANQRIVIEGHCDERGTREYNLALGERRAQAARDYLVNQGVQTGRITTISYGKERPVAVGSNEQSWAQNRRAVTVVASAGS
jgi:peptidoglycan-associated lipoprotein